MKDYDLKDGCGNKGCGCHNGNIEKCRVLWIRHMFNHVVVTSKTIKAFPYSCPRGRHNCQLCTYAHSGQDAHSKRLQMKNELPFIIRNEMDYVYDRSCHDDEIDTIDFVYDGIDYYDGYGKL